MKNVIIPVSRFLVCCFFGIFLYHLVSCSISTELYNWPPADTLPVPLQHMQICEGNVLIENQEEHQHILKAALPQAGCEKHLGSWLERQDCIQHVTLSEYINTSNPPQRTFSFKLEIKRGKQGNASLTYLDTKHGDLDCEKSCKFQSDFTCKGRFSLWNFSYEKISP